MRTKVFYLLSAAGFALLFGGCSKPSGVAKATPEDVSLPSRMSAEYLTARLPTKPDGTPDASSSTEVARQHVAIEVPREVADFDAWMGRYVAADPATRDGMLAEGRSLVAARRKVMGSLIASDPRTALLSSPSPADRANLPQELTDQLEQVVAGEGFYGVLAVCGDEQHHGSSIKREAIIGDTRYNAHVYGLRKEMNTQTNASLSGVALDGQIALHEDAIVVRAANEMPAGFVPDGGYAVTYKGITTAVTDKAELEAFVKEKMTPAELPLAASGPTFDPEVPPTGPAPPTVAYNEYTGPFAHQKGPKTVFVFLVEASDGASWTNSPTFASLDSQLNTASQNFYNVSYRQTWFGPKYKNPGTGSEVLVPRLVVSPVVRLSKTVAELSNALSTQAFDAKALVEAMGGDWTNNGPKDPDNFDRWVVMSNSKLVTSTGLAYVGGAIAWTANSLSSSVAEHEWGHNWGVVHANSWNVAQGEQPRAVSGTSGEYNDGWDIMGSGSMVTGFNTLFQEQLGFLERSRGEIRDVTTSGTYRLYDYIDPYSRTATSNLRALLIPMSSFTDSRRVFLGFGHVSGTDGGSGRSDWNRNAITVHSRLSDGSNRIDTTPYSQQTSDANDSSIKIGRTYTEGPNVNGAQLYGGFSVTPVQRGSTASGGNTHEWMDVVVNYGSGSPNAPLASFSQTTYAAGTGSPLAFSVTASDPDGDTLAYDWDFGDGTYSTANSASQSKTWNASGFYLVTCTVSDMKGKTAAATCWVNVGAIAYRPPENPSATLGDVNYRYYEGTFATMPDFATLLPLKSGTVSGVSISPRNRNDNFAFLFEGYIDVPTTDIYTFNVTSDDGARFYIGNTLVVDNNALQATAFSKSGSIALNAGKQKFRLEYFHKDGSEALTLAWSTRTTSPTPVPVGSFSQADPATNAAPAVSIGQPVDGEQFLVNSDILLQAEASDGDGIASVVFFADGSYLGTDTTSPYSYSWPKVSVGAKSVVAVATDNTGRWTQSAPVTLTVVSPAPQPSIGLNMNTKNASGGSMFFSDVSGAVYPQPNWVNLVGLSGSSANVVDYLGNPTTMNVSWVGTANGNYGDGSSNADTATGPGRMFKGLSEIRQDEAQRPSLTATNVPYPQYDVYVYFDLRGNDIKDTAPQRFICTPTEGAPPADVYGKNSLSSSDAVGDYPVYDTWVGFKESTATTAVASNDALLGNYAVFRGLRGSGFTMTVDRQIAATQQKLGFNAVQIVRSAPTAPFLYLRQTGGGTSATEGGTGDSYSVALGYAPDSNVTVAINSGSQLFANPSTLTFTPSNWSVPQAVNLTAVDDSNPEGTHSGTITHSVSASGNYNGVTAPPLVVAISDNDQPTVTVRATGAPGEAVAPIAGTFQFTRGGVGSLVLPLTVSFQMSGAADLSADYTLTGAGVSYASGTGVGTVTIPAGQAQVFLSLTPVNDTVAERSESATLTLQSGAGYASGVPGSATLLIADDDGTDYLTEFFDTAGEFDLNGKSLTLVPGAGQNKYTASMATVSAFPSGTSGFSNFSVVAMTGGTADDGWWTQTLPANFSFFGVNYSTIHVVTNGALLFTTSPSAPSFPTLSGHFVAGTARIDGLWADLNPGAGGTVRWKRDTTAGQARTIYFWDAVRNYGVTTAVSFQTEIFDDGRIRVTWLNSTLNSSALVGIASGNTTTMPSSPYTAAATPKPFIESNLSDIGGTATVNSPPVFASVPIPLGTTGQSYQYAVACTDLENNVLAITAPTKPVWLTLTDNGNGTAALSGTPTTPGTYPVVLQVTDGTTSVQQSFSITVIPSNGNTAPQFSSSPTLQASAGAAFSYTVAASDTDGHAISFSAADLPSWLTLVDNGNGTATLSGIAPDSGVQNHPVTILVSDGLTSVVQSFIVSLNRPPVIVLSSPASGFVELPDRSVTLQLDAFITDDGLPGGSSVAAAWSVVSSPGGVTFGSPSMAATTVKFDVAGLHILRLTASDGAAATTRDVYVFVESDGDAIAANGLQGWWKFDEDTGTLIADNSGNGRTLTLNGATTGGDGIAGKAYTGDASVTQNAENSTLALPAQVTMSAWIFAAASPATNDRYIFNFHSSGNNRLRLYLANGTSRLRLFSDRSVDGLWEAQYAIPAFEWVHIAVSYDASSVSADPVFYINGRQVGTSEIGNVPSGAQVAAPSFRIGGNNNNTSWPGRIDEARIYNRIVPAAEVPLLSLVSPLNAAPLVNAGADGDTAAGALFSLAGTASDDGAPNPPATLSLQWDKINGPGAVVFGDTVSATTTVSSNSAGLYVLRLLASDGDVSVFDEVSISVVASATGFASWAGGYNLGSLAGPNDDPDGDGISNFLEYALGGHPAQKNAPLLTFGTAMVESSERLALTFVRARADLTYTVESSPDLSTWTPIVHPDLTDPAKVGQSVTIPDSSPISAGTKRFLRLKISAP